MSTAGCAAAMVATLGIAAQFAHAQWDVEYYASSLVYPEDNGTGWAFYNGDPGHFQRGFVDNTLWADTMPPGDPWAAMGWQNTTGNFDFDAGFVMEARLKMVQATDQYGRWGGAEIYSRSNTGYNLGIDVDPHQVILGSIFNYVSYPMDTTDTFHTYRAEALNNYARLYVDGTLRLEMALVSDNPDGWLWFGDQGWEGGEMYFEYVRYAGVPAPGAAGVLVLGGLAAARRRR